MSSEQAESEREPTSEGEIVNEAKEGREQQETEEKTGEDRDDQERCDM